MNLFKKLFSSLKDEIEKTSRENSLKAQYNTFLATKSEEIVEKEEVIKNFILEKNKPFKDIVDAYIDLEILEDDLNSAKETYEYIFTEKEENEEA